MEITPVQSYGIVFLLGSLIVAALSDLRRMAAQKDFAEVWVVFIALMLLNDVFSGGQPPVLILKWLMICFFALLSWKYAAVVFALSEMDVAAVCAVLSLLNPLYIVLYYVVLWVVNQIMSPALREVSPSKGGSYPFLPVVFMATLVVFLVFWFGGIEKIFAIL